MTPQVPISAINHRQPSPCCVLMKSNGLCYTYNGGLIVEKTEFDVETNWNIGH